MLGGLAAFFALVVGSAHALNAAEPPSHGGNSLLVAKRESGLQGMPDATLETPAGPLRILNPELVAATFGQAIRFELTVARDVSQGSVDVTIPERWRARTVSGLVPSRIPRATRSAPGVRLQTGGGAATLELAGTNAGAQAAFEIVDTGIPAGTYKLPVSWTDAHGTHSLGLLEVRLYAPVREGTAPAVGSASNERAPFNVTNDTGEESETFITVAPNDPSVSWWAQTAARLPTTPGSPRTAGRASRSGPFRLRWTSRVAQCLSWGICAATRSRWRTTRGTSGTAG